MVKITAYTFRFFHSHSALAVLLLTALLTAVHPSDACTVFILTNGKQTITAETKNLFSDVTNGKLRYDDLSDDFSNNLKQNEAGVISMLERLGTQLDRVDSSNKEPGTHGVQLFHEIRQC